jgi:hypothetical protein
MAEYLKRTGCLLGLLVLLVAMRRTPPGNILSMLAKLWPLLLLLLVGRNNRCPVPQNRLYGKYQSPEMP